MTLEGFTQVLAKVMTICWNILDAKIILGTYSLWNVFTGVFAVWAFNFVFIKGVMQHDPVLHYSKKGFHYDAKGNYRKDKE